MVLQTVLGSGEMTITENWDILKIVTTKEKAENINVGDTIEYVPSWSEYKLSDLDRQMYDKGFRYKKILVAKNNEAVQLVNELLPVTLDTATPMSEGKMRDDCGDLRFYWWNEDTSTWDEISYWIDQDTMNTSATKIILKIPKVSASGYVNVMIYYGAMHYGRKDDLTIGFGNRSNEGKVLEFDGTDDYVDVSSVLSALNVNAGTIVAIFKYFSIDDYDRLVSSETGTGQRIYFGISQGKIWGRVGDTADTFGTTILRSNEVYVGALVWDTNMKLYLNGTLEADVPVDNFVSIGSSLNIGAQTGNSYFFNGKIYTVMIYNRALSDTEIQDIYDNPNDPPRAGLVLWYAPDSVDDVNGKWLDKSGLGNDGTINGATPVEVRTFEESVQTSKVMSFDGEDDYVTVPSPFEAIGLDWSAVILFRFKSINTSLHINTIFDQGNLKNSLYIVSDPQNEYYNMLRARVSQADGAVKFLDIDYIDAGKWYLFGISVQNNSVAKGYLNGVYTNEVALTDETANLLADYYIGKDTGGQYYANVDVVLFLVYNRALSDTEIQQIYENPNDPPRAGLVLWLDGTSIDEANGKWLNKAPALKSGYVELLDGVIYGATPTDLLSSAWSEEIDMNNGLRIVWRGKVVKKVESGGSVVLYVRANNLGKLIGEVV